MIHLFYSHRTEELVARLCRALAADRASRRSVLEPLDVVVPNANMERHVEFQVAGRMGVASHVRFRRLERLVRDWLEPRAGDAVLLDAATLRGLVLSALLDGAFTSSVHAGPVRAWLHAAGDAEVLVSRRRVQLAAQVGHLFLEYSLGRMELLRAWEGGALQLQDGPAAEVERWQSALWRRVLELARAEGGGEALTLHEAARRFGRAANAADPVRVHVFGLSYMARAFHQVLAVMSRHVDVHLYVLNPCLEFWEDVESAPELRARMKKRRQVLATRAAAGQVELTLDGDDPLGLLADVDNAALRLWGRPGREHVRLLNTLTDGNMEGPEPPARAGTATLLQRIQHDVVTRRPDGDVEAGATADGSVVLMACASPRRELEAVAERIWKLLEKDMPAEGQPPLRFPEIAVLVNGAVADRYMPLVSHVFHAARRLPHHLVDVPLWQQSRVADAAIKLLGLPHGAYARAEVMDVLAHPAVVPGDEGTDRRGWSALVERLGVFGGVDAADHAGTYLDSDVFTWSQGLRRVALGAFMAGAPSGEARLYDGAGHPEPVEEARADPPGAARWVLMARSLLADARALARHRDTAAGWSALLARYLGAYVMAPTTEETTDLRRVLGVVQNLARAATGDVELDARTAMDLVLEDLRALPGGRGEYLADGVVVSTLAPMRAIPFRHVFLVGMNEGSFPAAERRDGLDLRQARRQAGDVSPPERDRYAFLETLMSTRETFTVSHVSRDDQTGEELGPSSVVQELLAMVERNHGVPAADLGTRLPLRRADDPSVVANVHARMEAAAARRGRAERARLGGADLSGQVARLRTLEDWKELAELVAWPSVPADDVVATPPRAALPLSALVAFLRCPLQGWASTVLRMREDEDAAEDASDEPLESDARTTTALLRACLGRSGGVADAAMVEHAARVTVLQAAGRWPVGLPARILAEEHADLLRTWEAALRQANVSLPAVLGAHRLGPGRVSDDAVAVHPPLVVHVNRGDNMPALEVELTGRTVTQLPGAAGALVMSPRRPRDAADLAKVQLPAVVEAIVLRAAGVRAPGTYRMLDLVGTGGGAESVLMDTPVEEARAWVTGMVTALVEGPHPWFFPCEAVLTAATRAHKESGDWGGVPDARAVEDVLVAMKTRQEMGSSAWGPVPSSAARQVPSPRKVHDWLRARWGLVLQLLPPPAGR